ncbi:Flp pilus assembly protein CpaB [Sinomonas sp. JC656]|uniref:Flp pilus assembly protein CpaB n=2 Tax=Sinomonas cellulolyticus TaxID=2801916 RepID=A0ABS1JZF1_9MICC|nr:Flp pilus assembly protein CpaB [Sinomonas cellulolyticus]
MYVNGADARAMAGTETQDVYVVQKSIPTGTAAGSLGSSIAKKPVPKAVIASDAVTDIGQIQGKVAGVSLEPGEQLLTTRFVAPGSLNGPGRATVPDGMQEVTVRLPIERVVGGTLSAGDTVGVFVSFAKEDNVPAQTQLEFHKVLVTGIQMTSGAAAQNNATAAPQQSGGGIGGSGSSTGEYLVTIARSAADAEKIVFATEFGKVYLSKEPSTAAENNNGVVDRTKVFR